MLNNVINKLAIQSWCFRAFRETDKVIQAIKDSNVSAIELCGVHIDPMNSTYRDILKAYQDAGVEVTCFGVHWFNNDEDATRKVFEFAKETGLKSINADFNIDFLPMAERFCSEYDIKLSVHNHGRHHQWGSVRDLDKLFSQSSKNIGLCLDTAWMLDSGEDPINIGEKYAERLYGVHIKDFVFNRAGRPEDTIIGTGNLDINAFTKLLIDKGFEGTLTLEYEGDENNPVPATKECVKVVKDAFNKLS